MNTTDIQTRIEKTQQTIDKKHALIEKRYKTIEKTYNKIGNTCGMDAPFEACMNFVQTFSKALDSTWKNHQQSVYEKHGSDSNYYRILTEGIWEAVDEAYYNVGEYINSIESATREIAEKTELLATYRSRLAEAENKEKVIETMPACMREFMERTIECWDAWDKMRRASVREAHDEYYDLGNKEREAVREHGKDSEEAKAIRRERKEITDAYSTFEWNELYYLKDEQIHERNVKAGKSLILDLYYRVSAIVSTFEDASGLRLSRDNAGFAIINGLVKGNGKTAKVQSIGAGGYNIQRFHIRTLVHEVH